MLEFHHDGEFGREQRLDVLGAASVKGTVFDRTGKRVDGPLAAVGWDNIAVRHEEKRLRGPSALQARDEVQAVRIGSEKFRRDAILIGDALKVTRDQRFVSWRVAGVQLEEIGEVALGAVGERA